MPRHDYDLPEDWRAKSDEEKDQWYKNERSRRQAQRQQDAGSMPVLDTLSEIFERHRRKLQSRFSNYK